MLRRRRSGKARPIPPIVIWALTVLLLFTIAAIAIYKIKNKNPEVNDFASCAAAGNPILETYPEQCTHQGKSYFRPGQEPPKPY